LAGGKIVWGGKAAAFRVQGGSIKGDLAGGAKRDELHLSVHLSENRYFKRTSSFLMAQKGGEKKMNHRDPL